MGGGRACRQRRGLSALNHAWNIFNIAWARSTFTWTQMQSSCCIAVACLTDQCCIAIARIAMACLTDAQSKHTCEVWGSTGQTDSCLQGIAIADVQWPNSTQGARPDQRQLALLVRTCAATTTQQCTHAVTCLSGTWTRKREPPTAKSTSRHARTSLPPRRACGEPCACGC